MTPPPAQQLDLLERRVSATRPPVVRAFLGDELIVDNFAGGGGASSGVGAAIGRDPDIAINHDAEAIAMHAANHPATRHYTESVWQVDPVKACGGRPVALAWFSPDCKDHSKAKGGKPKNQKIRALAWVAVRWAAAVAPRVIALENVEEFQDWGPVVNGARCPRRKGQTFRAFVRKLERLGYVVEWRLLRACDYGAPTTRRRLFLVARNDGAAIRWPEPTHGRGRTMAHRTAAECIDWSIPCPSIFDRERPLADKTMARIARGVRKFVIESARPFLISVNHGGVGRRDLRVHDLDAPTPTVTGGQRGGHALVVPYMVHRSNGERVGQAPRVYDVAEPLRTVVSQGEKFALCAAFLARHYSDRATGGWNGGTAADAPLSAVTATNHHSVIATHLLKFQENSDGQPLDEPMHTVMAGAARFAQVAAFLVRYNGTGDAEPVDRALGTLTSKPRFGLVTVTIDGEEYVIVDIGMRMLTPRELFRAQGFGDEYVIDPVGPKGKPLTKTAQIRMCGNSVAPPIATAIARANLEAA